MPSLPEILNNASDVFLGSVRPTVIYMGDKKVWPNAYVWELTPDWSSPLTNELAATGGSVTATWYLTGKQNGVVVYDPVEVTPTGYTLNGPSGFSYTTSTGVLQAANRGSNGFDSAPNSTPSQEQLDGDPITCQLSVSYNGTVTIGGQPVTVAVSSAWQEITQAENPGTDYPTGNVYHNFSVSLDRYDSESNPAPASRSTATISSVSGQVDYAYRWTTTSTTKYNQNNSLSRSAFVFSSNQTWATINTSGTTVTAASRGTQYSVQKRSATITASLNQTSYPGITTSATTDIWQDINDIKDTSKTNISYGMTGFSLNWNSGNASALSAGETGALSYTYCREYFYYVYTYSSGESKTDTNLSHTDIIPTYSTSSSYSWRPSISSSTVTATKRLKTETSARSGRVIASYDSHEVGHIDISQAGTVVTYTLNSNYDNGIELAAYRQEITPSFTGTIAYDNGDSNDTDPNPSVSDAFGVDISNRISHSGKKIIGFDLGYTVYNSTASTSYTYTWTKHSTATREISVTQVTNIPTYGDWDCGAGTNYVYASGTSPAISLWASATASWPSRPGNPQSLTTSNFAFSISSKGNDGKRTYSLSGSGSSSVTMGFGSLGTNGVNSEKTTTISVSNANLSSPMTISFTEQGNELTPGAISASAGSTSIPASGSSNIALSASCPTAWTSGSPGSTIISGFTYTITSYGNNGKRTYSLNSGASKITFGSLEYNVTSQATTVVTVSYSGATSDTINFTEAKNEKYRTITGTGIGYEYSSWTFTASINQYGTEANGCPKGGGTSTLTVTANHWQRQRDETYVEYTWDSNATPVTDTLYGPWSTLSKVSDLGAITNSISGTGFSIGNMGSDGKATITITQNTGNARSGLITVSRSAVGDQTAQAIGIWIYQKAGNIAVSVNPSSINTTYDGGTYNISVTAVSSGWSLSYSNGSPAYPIFTGNSNFSPTSGNAGTTTLVVTVPSKPISQYQNPTRYATITLTATEEPSATATISVEMERPITPDEE